MDFHVFVTPAVSVLQGITALRTKITFNVNPVMLFDLSAELVRNEMQRLFVHRAVFDSVNRAGLDLGPIFQPTLKQVDNGRLAAADRSHQQKDALAHFQTLGGRFEVLDNSGYGFFDAKEFMGKEVVGENLVLSTFVEPLDAPGMNHVVDASV